MVWQILALLALVRVCIANSVVDIDARNFCNCSVSRGYHCKGLRFGSQEVAFSARIFCGNVYFEDSDLYTIPKNAFHLMSSTGSFGMVNCNLTQIFKWNFEGGDTVFSLNLDSNRIASIPSAVFEYLSTLEELYLRKNRISTVESGAFLGLGILLTLQLDDNDIRYLGEDTFHPLQKLTTIGLSDNQIEHLPEGIFAQNSFLEYVYLDNNKLKIIDPKTPVSLTKFEEPFNITSTAIFRLPNVLSLRLSGNYLPYLSNTTFSAISNLQVLYVERAHISHIEPDSLHNLQQLILLSFAENNLDSFNVNVLEPLHILTRLQLHGNNLTHLDYELLPKVSYISSITLQNNSWTCPFQRDMSTFFTSAGVVNDLDSSSCPDEIIFLKHFILIIAIVGGIIIAILVILIVVYIWKRKRPHTYVLQKKV